MDLYLPLLPSLCFLLKQPHEHILIEEDIDQTPMQIRSLLFIHAVCIKSIVYFI